MIVDALKSRIQDAMKRRDSVASTILRLAFGEIQTNEARLGRAVNEDEATAIIRKLIKSNEETRAISTDSEQQKTLDTEIALLKELLPASMGIDALEAALAAVKADIVSAKSEGQATGVAMKHLKSTGANAASPDVVAVVKKLRA